MTKVLIGNKDIQTDLKNFQFLKNSNEYDLIFSNTGRETINKCRTISPNIIILDSNIQDMAFTEIIDRISTLPDENNKCNLILTVNNPNHKLLLSNTSIIYKIFDYNLENNLDTKKVKEAVNDLTIRYKTPDITKSEVLNLISKLGIFPYSIGTSCLVSAIFKCYYHPEFFSTLDLLYSKVTPEYDNLTQEDIKNKIRHSIDTMNISNNTEGANLYFEIFGNLTKVSPRVFIYLFVNYLNKIKGKK